MNQYRGTLFKTEYQIEAFKRWVLMNKLELSDQLVKKQISSSSEAPQIYSNTIELINRIKTGIK